MEKRNAARDLLLQESFGVLSTISIDLPGYPFGSVTPYCTDRMCRPIIYIKDGNYKNRGELFLEHRYSGVELQMNYAQDTLANLYKLWKRPVHIETMLEDAKVILSFDGQEHSRTGDAKPAKSK